MNRVLICLSGLVVWGLTITGWTLNPIVDPLGGGTHENLNNAVQAVITAGEPNNTITLMNTAVHDLSTSTTGIVWNFVNQNVTFAGNSATTRPVVIMPHRSSGRYQITILNSASDTATITIKDLIFLPDASGTGIIVPNSNFGNVNDGFSFEDGFYVLDNVLFSANNGSDGPASVDGSVPYTESPAFSVNGDDWLQFEFSVNGTTITQTVITGANDDGLMLGYIGPAYLATTIIANNGGAGIQIFDDVDLTLDGQPGPLIIGHNGFGTGGGFDDTNLKSFWQDATITATNVDFLSCNNGSFYDFDGSASVFRDCRFILGAMNTGIDRGQIAFNDLYSDGAGVNGWSALFERCTFHDAGNNIGLYMSTNALPAVTFTDCIFSGAGDAYQKALAATIAGTNNAIAQEGPHAVGNPANLPAANSVTLDPDYASLAYAVGPAEWNPDLLRVQHCFYAGKATGGADLVGGAGGSIVPCPTGIDDWRIHN